MNSPAVHLPGRAFRRQESQEAPATRFVREFTNRSLWGLSLIVQPLIPLSGLFWPERLSGPIYMDFDQQLRNAIARGSRSRDARNQAAQNAAMTAEERKQRHMTLRLDLSDQIEDRLRKLADHFPGFTYSTLIGDDGWGARITRDDLNLMRGRTGDSLYSRLEMVISPLGNAPIIELVAKGTIRNREVFNRRHFQSLDEVDLSGFNSMINLWSVEYAEQFASDTNI